MNYYRVLQTNPDGSKVVKIATETANQCAGYIAACKASIRGYDRLVWWAVQRYEGDRAAPYDPAYWFDMKPQPRYNPIGT